MLRPSALPAMLVCSMLASFGNALADWQWPTTFTDKSSPELIALHTEILKADLSASPGVPVKDVHFLSDRLDVHLISGTVFAEPEVEGYPAGAFFTGEATVSFTPQEGDKARALADAFGTETLDRIPIGWAYFFTLRGQPLVEQLGVDAEGSVKYEPSNDYSQAKRAMRQLGLTMIHAFLNRTGRSDGAAYVLFAPASIRGSGEDDAALLYVNEPHAERPVELDVFGHSRAIHDPLAQKFLRVYPIYKYRFWPVVRTRRPLDQPFDGEGKVAKYTTSLTVGHGSDVDEQTTIAFTPADGLAALSLALTPRLEVTSVTGPGGEELPFAQWKYVADQPSFDESLLVVLGDRVRAGQAAEIHVTASGPLLDPGIALNAVAEEDIWLPQVDDPDPALYELHCDAPKNMRAVSAGKLVSEDVADGRRRYVFLTSRPQTSSSFYVGDYEVKTAEADDTQIELFYKSVRDTVNAEIGVLGGTADYQNYENPGHAVEEVANAVKIFNRILDEPLEIDHLRVATTPTGHGRGFEGLLLLSQYAATRGDLSVADLFRAHEVAHEWWGHMVRPLHWPEDRWLEESFAEYCAMEYYRLRFQKPEKTRQMIHDQWWNPLFMAVDTPVVGLTGEQQSVNTAELAPLIDGTANVYTKGPLVLNMLRYLFEVQKKSDQGFWTLLQDFIDKYKYQQAGTQDFMRMTEEAFQGRLDWFWQQWIYGTDIPVVHWKSTVTKDPRGWLVTVEATQDGTKFVMPIPVYIHAHGDKTYSTPLVLRGGDGAARAVVADKPKDITLNDNYEALVDLRH